MRYYQFKIPPLATYLIFMLALFIPPVVKGQTVGTVAGLGRGSGLYRPTGPPPY